MMRFNVGGQFLELPDNFSVQFKKTNILFAFDKAECERSASFDVPDTPTNDRIFGISKWIQTSGDGMRRRYDAQLQASGVTFLLSTIISRICQPMLLPYANSR